MIHLYYTCRTNNSNIGRTAGVILPVVLCFLLNAEKCPPEGICIQRGKAEWDTAA